MTGADAVTAAVHIAAPPEVVFRYFTTPALLTSWMGQWADLDPVPGGTFAVDVNGAPIRGEFVVIDAPARIVFTWGTPGSSRLPEGSSTVEVTFTPDGSGGTLVELVHRDLPAEENPKHRLGWAHFFAVLAGIHARQR